MISASLLTTLIVSAQAFYASPTGVGDGLSASTPGSIATVQGLARAAQSDVTIYFRGGVYTLQSTLALTSLDSGGTYTREWRAYPGELPVFSGAIQVTGWSLIDVPKNIYRASVPVGTRTRHLWVNGLRASRAAASPAVAATFSTATSGATYVSSNATVPTFARPQDLELGFNNVWFQLRLGVTSATRVADVTTLTMDNAARTFWSGIGGVWPGSANIVENAYEFLSASTTGSWYLDESTNFLYYVPRPGENMASVDVRLPVLTQLMTLTGVTDITFSGIAFEHSAWLDPYNWKAYIEGGGQGQRIKNAGVWDGTIAKIPVAVNMIGCSRVTFRRNAFTHLGASGLGADGTGTNLTVQGNIFTDISIAALNLGDNVGGLIHTNLLVRSNYIHDVSLEIAKPSAQFGIVRTSQFLHNVIEHVPYSGMATASDINGSLIYGVEYGWNRVVDHMKTLTDGGALYAYEPQALAQVAPNRNSIHDNYTETTRNADIQSIFLDNGSRSWDVTNNVVYTASPYWMKTAVDSLEDVASGNYASTINSSIGGTSHSIAAPTLINGTTPSNWPAMAQTIYNASGLDTENVDLLNWLEGSTLLSTNPVYVPPPPLGGLFIRRQGITVKVQLKRGSRNVDLRHGPIGR